MKNAFYAEEKPIRFVRIGEQIWFSSPGMGKISGVPIADKKTVEPDKKNKDKNTNG